MVSTCHAAYSFHMESDSSMPRADAVDAVLAVERVRARVADEPCDHAVLQLAYAVMVAAYMGILVYTGSIEGGRAALGGHTMALVLPPIIISSALIPGASEHYSRRMRPSRRHWWSIGLFLAMLLVLLVWGLTVGYPWWLSVGYATATLVLFGTRPLWVLSRSRSTPWQRRSYARMSRGVQVITVLLGIAFGALCLGVLVPVLLWGITVIVLMAALVVLAVRATTWSLHHVGYEWAWPQWTAFGVAVAAMFLFAVLMVAGVAATPLTAGVAAVLAVVPLAAAAFFSGHGDDASEA